MQTQRIIVPIGVRTGYLEASKIAKKLGGKLPANPLHDEYVARSDRWEKLPCYYAAWARELLVHPEKGGKFKKGRDIVDSETGWTVPASYIPKEAFGTKGVGLFVDPGNMQKEKGRVIVHPAGKIAVLAPFIQESRNPGNVDEVARIPLALGTGSDMDMAWFWRINGVGVRPLVRGRNHLLLSFNGQDVNANLQPGCCFGVALELELPAKNPEGARAVFAQILSLFEQRKTEIRDMGFNHCVIESSIRSAAGANGVNP